MNNIFEEYDIFSYVQNLTDILNEEKVIFFLSHNLQTSKLYIVFIYSVIYDNFSLLKKIFFYLKVCSLNNDDFHYITYLILFIDFLTNFFKDFQSLSENFFMFIEDILKKIFDENEFKKIKKLIYN